MSLAAETTSRHPDGSILDRLNGRWHRPALLVFMAIVVAHWAEHVVQAFQIWGLGHPDHEARGVLGEVRPWLVTSEWLHFAYAVVMLAGLVLLAAGFPGRSRAWWIAALGVQAWHLVEHGLLFVQAQAHHPLFGRDVPTSVLQLLFPRVELHLAYNGVVTLLMVVAMGYHLRPPSRDAAAPLPG